MMPTIAPKYPSNPWDINNQRNRGKNNGKNIVFPVRTTTLTPVSTTTTTTTTTLPPSKTLKLIFPKSILLYALFFVAFLAFFLGSLTVVHWGRQL